MATRKKRRLRKEIRWALYILIIFLIFILILKIINGSFSFIGIHSKNNNASFYRNRNCLVFYPEKAKKARDRAQNMCADIKEKTVYDYDLKSYGDFYAVDWGVDYYLVNSEQADYVPVVSEENQKILKDYLFYSLKKENREEIKDLSFYDNVDTSFIIHGIKNDELVIKYNKYDIEASLPLSDAQHLLDVNFGMENKEYIAPHYIQKGKKIICLTFDDGPSLENDPILIDLLNKYNVRATFFVLGNRLSDKTIDLIKGAVKDGFEYGSHTQSHKNLLNLSQEDRINEILTPYRDLKNAFGYEMKYYRPPYGAYKSFWDDECGLNAVLWNVDSLDWQLKDKDKIVENVKNNEKDKAIILFHDIYKTTIEAVQELIPYWILNDYEIVSVSEMLELIN